MQVVCVSPPKLTSQTKGLLLLPQRLQRNRLTGVDRVLFDWVSSNQIQSYHNSQSEQGKIASWVNEKAQWKRVNCVKRGKTLMSEARLVLVLHLIGCMGEGRVFSRPITERSKASLEQFGTDQDWFRHSFENYRPWKSAIELILLCLALWLV